MSTTQPLVKINPADAISRWWQLSFTLLMLLAATLTGNHVNAKELPDFEQLVADYAPTVVNIQASGSASVANFGGQPNQAPPGQQVPEFLQRFFQFQGPNGPGGASPYPQPQQKSESIGSGVIVSQDGFIITNAHVVRNAKEIKVRLHDRKEYTATLIGSDHHSDIAVLKISANDLSFAKLGDSDDVRVGQWVLAIGAPFGLEQTATQGIVSAVSRSLPNDTYVPFIQTDVALNPGNSGGPLFNLAGEVVGINSQIFSRTGGYMGLSFAIPINLAESIAERLKTDGEIQRGWLGIGIQELDSNLAHSFKLAQPTGTLIRSIEANSPAAASDLKTGDVILRYNGTEILRSADLPPLVASTEIGQTVPLTILRNGKQQEVKITVGTLAAPGIPVAATEPGPLGITVADLSDQERLNAGLSAGVRVAEVVPGKPGANAGLSPNDIILSFANEPVRSAAELARLSKSHKPGSVVPMLVQRNDHTQYFALEFPPA